MKFSEEVLMAYADGELEESTRAAVEAAMAEDPQIARRIAHHRALRERLRSAFEPALREPVPARLLEAARNCPAGSAAQRRGDESSAKTAGERSGETRQGPGNVIPLRARAARRWSLPQWAALAASLVIGILAGRLAFRSGGSEAISTHNGRMMASGLLADALSAQLASRQRATQPVRIGVSFKSKSGRYCRTFSMRAPAVAGLACHASDGWRLRVLTGAQERGGTAGAYRQAASATPPAVVAAVNREIAGEPLDARAEAAARNRGWKP